MHVDRNAEHCVCGRDQNLIVIVIRVAEVPCDGALEDAVVEFRHR